MVTIPAPMLAPDKLYEPFTDPGWLYQTKHDGYRCMAGVSEVPTTPRVDLRTRSGAPCSARFPEVCAALENLPGGPHVVDGEVCVLRPDGTSDFNQLQDRARRRRPYPGCAAVTFCVFDLLIEDGERIMGLPLVERLERLLRLVAPLAQSLRTALDGPSSRRKPVRGDGWGWPVDRGRDGQAAGQHLSARPTQR